MAAAALLAALLMPHPAFAVLNPTAPKAAPVAVERLTPYLPQVDCDPTAKPGTTALRTLLLHTYGGRDLGITRACGIGATSEHKDGRAFDWGLAASNPVERAVAQQFLTWLLAIGPDKLPSYNARRLGVMYVIWDGRIWGAYTTTNGGWKSYGGAEAHTDHIHLSLSWAGAMKRTSFWTGKAAPVDYGTCRQWTEVPAAPYRGPRASPCPPPATVMTLLGTPVLRAGGTGAYVGQLQKLLGISVDGQFGAHTAACLVAFQRAHRLSPSGATDSATWTALRAVKAAAPKPSASTAPPADPALSQATYQKMTLRSGATGAAVRALQAALHVTPDGSFGPRTAAAVAAYNTAHGLGSAPVATPATWAALGRPAIRPSPLATYAKTTLRTGSTGAAVRALQTALHVAADGAFGPATAAVAAGFNAAHGLARVGTVTPATWAALIALDQAPRK